MATNYENSTQKTGSIAGKECLCTTEEMLKIKKQYQEIVNRGRAVGANWAAQMLQHWMNGSGKDMVIKMEVLKRFGQIEDAEKNIRKRLLKGIRNRKIIDNLLDSKIKSKKYYIYAKEDITAPLWSEFFYASGTSSLVGRMLLKADKKDDKITINTVIEYHWFDPYDWHVGLSAYIPTVGTIDDDDADKYESAGCAKKFDMYSFWYQSFKETYTIDDILWFYDTDSIEWGEIKEGRASVNTRGSWLDWSVNNRRGVEYKDGRLYPGLGKGKNGDKDAKHSAQKERRDREERSREDARREDRRRRR